MLKLPALSLALCFISCTKNTADTNPNTIKPLLERLDACSHFSGEIGGDNSDRDKEVKTEMERLKCDTIDVEVTAAKEKFKNNPEILKAIQQAEAF